MGGLRLFPDVTDPTAYGPHLSGKIAHYKPTIYKTRQTAIEIVHLTYEMPIVPNLFGTRDWFHERQFFHRPGGDDFRIILVH